MTPEGYGNKVGIKQGNTLCFVTQDMNPGPRSMHVAAVLLPHTRTHTHILCMHNDVCRACACMHYKHEPTFCQR